MSSYIDIRLSNEEIQNYDIAFLPEDIKNRYSDTYAKYGGDDDFFFTVYSVAVTDWVISKNKEGKKVKSISSHLSNYFSKEIKRRETGTDLLSRKKAGENIFPESAADKSAVPETIKKKEVFSETAETSETAEEPDFLSNMGKVTETVIVGEIPDVKPFNSVSEIKTDEKPEDTEVTSAVFLDLISDTEENEIDEDQEMLEVKDFERHGKKRHSLIISFIVLFSVIIIAAVVVSVKGGTVKKPVKNAEPIEDFEVYGKTKVDNVESAMNKNEEKELKEQKPPEEPVKIQKQTVGGGATVKKSPSGGTNKNTMKDEEILEKYSGSNAGAGVVRAERRGFKAGGTQEGGGVFLQGGFDKDAKGMKQFVHKNIKIKVQLQFSIRSTAATTVVAVVTEGTDQIPEGSKFYGSASGYVNSRTQIRFSKLLTAGEEFSVKGFAISGRDPGIPSEVTDVSGNNIKAGVKQGLVKTAGAVVDNVASKLSGGISDAATNTSDPAESEYQKELESDKMTQEYRVPAGTSFYIYLE